MAIKTIIRYAIAVIAMGMLLSACQSNSLDKNAIPPQPNSGDHNERSSTEALVGIVDVLVVPGHTLSIVESNSKAIKAFSDAGLDAVQSEKGVTVYLPPEVYFNGNDSKISLLARSKITQIANEINKPYLFNRMIEVAGHSDSVGNEQANKRLSLTRANAAAGELVFSTVDPNRLQTSSYGESQPRYPELNKDGSVNEQNRERNRRVEFIVLNP